MVDITISELPAKTSLLDSDIIPIDDGKQTFRVTGAQLREFLKVNFLSVGTVVWSQSNLATDNPGRLPLWTGEYIASASTIYPDFYTWVKDKHPELCKTKEQYDATLTQFGECPFYVVDEEEGSLRLPKLSLLNRQLVERKEATETDPTWYNLYSDGYLEQGGKIGRTSAGQTTTIKLVKPFANTNYTVLASTKPDDSDSISGRIYTVSKNLTTTSFNVTNNGWTSEYNGITGFWEAKGYVGTNSLENNFPWVFAYNATVPASTAQAAAFQEGLSIKADLDLSNTIPSQTFKGISVSWAMPDFSRTIDISSMSEYTAPDDGYIFAYSGVGKYQGCSLTVQGVNLINTGRNDVDVDATSMTAPIGKGETCTLSASGGKIFFVPCKGV